MELLNKRTYSSKTHDNLDGSFTLEAHTGHIHYKDAQGDFQDVNYALEDAGAYWQMTKANYRLFVNKYFDDGNVIRFDNKYKGANHSIIYKPHSLQWINATDLSDMVLFRAAQNVPGTANGNKITYTNAFGPGLHFEVTLFRSGFKKEIIIESKGSLELPPTPDHKLVVLFRYTGSGLKVLKNDLAAADWDETGYYDSLEGFTVGEIANRQLRSFIRKAYIEDSTDPRPARQSLRVFWTKHNLALWQAKVLPNLFLQDATYPVRADTTTSYYSGVGDGHVGYYVSPADWDTAHDATVGTGLNYTGVAMSIGCYSWGSTDIHRGFLPIDTDALPNNAIVTIAELKLYATSKGNLDNDGDDFIRIVQTDQPDPTELTVDDYNNCGATDNPTAGAADIDIGNITTSAYNTWTLNATGRGWINKTGYTLLGAREGHDVIDSPIAASSENEVLFSTSEQTGTAQDPYLSVTYLVPSASPSASPSGSPSASPSATPSGSPSEGTPSGSPSASPSATPSGSPSGSPSQGWESYSRGAYGALPAGIDDLTTPYDAQDYLDVDTKNDVRVGITAGADAYAIHQFNDFVGDWSSVHLEWEGQSDIAPSASAVFLQIYNYNLTIWETKDTDNSSNADEDFTLEADINDLSDYKSGNIITCRIYQQEM